MFEHAGGGGAGLGLRTDHVLDQIQSDDVIWRGKERKKERIFMDFGGFVFQTYNCVWISDFSAGWDAAFSAEPTCQNVGLPGFRLYCRSNILRLLVFFPFIEDICNAENKTV